MDRRTAKRTTTQKRAKRRRLANPFRWVGAVGYYYDEEVGTYYVRARNYDALIARWLSQDPLFLPGQARPSYSELEGLYSSYSYSRSSPTEGTDPSGYLTMSYRGRLALRQCGDFTWAVQFLMDRGNPNERRGWIVQRVTVSADVLNCATGRRAYTTECPGRPTDPEGTLVYYERWRVENWRVSPGAGRDTFRNKGGFGNRTRTLSNYTQRGEVAFFPGADPPPGDWAGEGEPGHSSWAGQLQTTCDAPGFPWNGGIVATRGLGLRWDCCCEDRKDTILTKYEWNNWIVILV